MATQITNSPDRQKALNLVLNQIEKSFGKGAIMRLGDAAADAGRNHIEWGDDPRYCLGWRFAQR